MNDDIESIRDSANTVHFTDQICRNLGDYLAVQELFTNYVNRGVFREFLNSELRRIAADGERVVRSTVGQLNFSIISDRRLDFTVRLSPPMKQTPHGVKWLGCRQLIGIEGPGVAVFRVSSVPQEVDINSFEEGLSFDSAVEIERRGGEFLFCQNDFEILDLIEVRSVVILYSLTIKNPATDLHWTFDQHGSAVFTESSDVSTSRLRNALEIAETLDMEIPPRIYDLIFSRGDPYLKLFAIQSLLKGRNERGFIELNRAMESDNDILRAGSLTIFDAFFAGIR